MRKTIFILFIGVLLTSCAGPRSSTNSLELGMSKDEVRAMMGEPDSSAAIKGQSDCYYYSMWRDFWNRSPGNYSDRYYVCFQVDKTVIAYGRVGDPL